MNLSGEDVTQVRMVTQKLSSRALKTEERKWMCKFPELCISGTTQVKEDIHQERSILG